MTEISDPEGGLEAEKAEKAESTIDPQLASIMMPLLASELSPGVAQLVGGPIPMKMMAARGISPLRPPELAVALFQLTFDAEVGIQNAARGAPVALPDALLLPMLKEPLPPPVLHFLGTHLAEHRGSAIEALLYNPRTPDQTFVVLARKLWGENLEIICQNELRLLRCPAIVKSLFGNPAARMSSVNRAIELCARNNVEVDIPAYREIAKSILDDPQATSTTEDEAFDSVAKLAALDTLPPEVEAELLEEIATEASDVATEVPAKPVAERKKKSAVIDFTRLKLAQKIRLATFGNEYCRFNLIRDGNRLVAMAAARSPKIGDREIVAAAASKAVHQDVVRYISGRREFLRIYAVRIGLVTNPKCPPQESMRLVSTLMINDIKRLAKSRNIPNAIQIAAKRIIEKRGRVS